MRTIIIGDIHGCYRELVKLLEKVEFDKKTYRLISLGDLMDRDRLDREEITESLPEVLMWDRTQIDQNDYHGKLTIIGYTPIEDATWYVGDEATTEVLPEHKWMPLPETTG